MNKKIKFIIVSVAIVALLIVGYFWLDNILFDGVKPKYVSENGFSATLFSNNNTVCKVL